MERKKIAKAAILSTAIVGGVLMFASPFDAQAYSGGVKKACYYAGPDLVYCMGKGTDCGTAVDCL